MVPGKRFRFTFLLFNRLAINNSVFNARGFVMSSKVINSRVKQGSFLKSKLFLKAGYDLQFQKFPFTAA